MTEPIVDAAPALDFDLKSLPKVSLHDHLDGGLRPQTIVELAAEDPERGSSMFTAMAACFFGISTCLRRPGALCAS